MRCDAEGSLRNSLVAELETCTGIGCARAPRLSVLGTYLASCARGERYHSRDLNSNWQNYFCAPPADR